jgi:pimeloyl-ACP methyl ester carboxylesterase
VSRFIYLHGFASSPASTKARFFAERFAQLGLGLEVPDLAENDFSSLTLSAQIRVIERTARDEPVSLIGSSMGGYLAALYAARHLETEQLVLLAPAFSFRKRWTEMLGPAAIERWKESGSLDVFNYALCRHEPLGFQLMEDADRYEPYPDCPQPALILQGRNDTVVPPEYAEEYVRRHPDTRLRLLDTDHEMLNALDDMWMETEAFLFPNPG